MAPKRDRRKMSMRVDDDRDRQVEPLRPAFDNLPFLRMLLSQGKETVERWPQQIALALGLADFYVQTRHSILVDIFFNYLVFAVQSQFTAEKTRAFIDDQEQLRKFILQDPEPSWESTVAHFKSLILQRTKPPPPPPQVVEIPELEEEAEKDKAKKDKGKPKGKEEAKDALVRDVKKEVAEHVAFTVNDVTSITDFTMKGILQHRRLYRAVFTREEARPALSCGAVRTIVEAPAAPLPLRLSLPEQQFVEAKAAQAVQQEEEERRRLREFEEKTEADRRSALQRQNEEEQRLQKEKERVAHMLVLSNDDAKVLVAVAARDIEGTLNARRQRLLERLAALEEKVGIPPAR